MGNGLTVFAMPVLVRFGLSWRWIPAGAGIGLLMVPLFILGMPESVRWERADERGDAVRSRFYDVFVPMYRRRTAVLIVCTFLANIAGEGIGSWSYFHAVRDAGLSASAASALSIIAGGFALAGFPVGAWSAERFGRVGTVVWTGIALAVGAALFFWGPPTNFAHPIAWLGISFCIMSVFGNASAVASYSAITELYPTSLRGTIIGWAALLSAIGSLTAESAISFLARPLGSASTAVGWLAMAAIPASILFGVAIDETQGMELEKSAGEAEFSEAERSRARS
jgi:MFS family permease